MSWESGYIQKLWGKTRLGIWGFCLVATSALCLPAEASAYAGSRGVGVAFLAVLPQEEATTEAAESTETPAATEGESAAPATEEAAPAEAPAEEVAPATFASGSELNYVINTLIMLICAVLVIFMQGGFSLVEAGLNSSKNTVNILFKNLMDFSIGAPLYLLLGFGLMYPGADYAGKWFGYSGPFVTRDLGQATDGAFPNYSSSADFLFQVAFAATAATIVSGAVAGRMKFTGYLIYSGVITAFVYPVSGMWKWGGGALAAWGFADFAGSILVHAVGGFAALAGALALGPRIGRYTSDGRSVPIPGHNLTFAALGVFILWVGWYGFNPGSQLTYSGAANAEATAYIAVTTTISGAIGAVVAMLLSWILFRKPDLTMALNGVLAGLVGITANCDQVSQVSAVIIGAVSGLLVVLGILALDRLKIDDPVGAFPVHGLCGLWGGLATGIFGEKLPEAAAGSQMAYFMIQLKSSLIVCAWSFVTMFVLFMILKVIGLLRVSPAEEMEGLDVAEHGQHAYTA